jgi:putative ABC transport system substrate-binding protein
MDRRRFICCLAALSVSRTAGAQPARKFARIGIITSGFATAELRGPNPDNATVAAFLRGMRELGYEYGKDFVTEPRGGDGKTEQFHALAAELVRLPVDVIVAGGPTLPAVMQATASIPVVMVGGALDPVRDGFARSLGKPGGNITGLSIQQVDTTAKRLEILKEMTPRAPVAALWEATSRSSWRAGEAAARARGWKVVSLEVSDAASVERAFKMAASAGAGALLVVGGGRLFGQRQQVVDLAAAYRLPAMYSLRSFVDAGGLMSYGADLYDSWRRSANFVDRILKGAKPAEMPIEQSTKFELVINLKTAKTLGLTVPRSLILRADQIVD